MTLHVTLYMTLHVTLYMTTRDTTEIYVILATYKICGKYNNNLIRTSCSALFNANARNKDVAGVFVGTLRKCSNNDT
jgi:F0F1-type ATP synthase gamma subunit